MLSTAKTTADLGHDFGATLTEQELHWSIANEFTLTAEDMIWRRSKLGLRLSKDEIADLDKFFRDHQGKAKKTPKRRAKLFSLHQETG